MPLNEAVEPTEHAATTPRFVTLTLNPSFDLTMEVTEIAIGGVTGAVGERWSAGGKGVNVARCLARLGHGARAVIVLGSDDADRYRRLLGSLDELALVPIDGSIRTNIAVVTTHGAVTKINGPGPSVLSGDLPRLFAAITRASRDAGWVALCGSAPPGVPIAWIQKLTAALVSSGYRVAIDTGGERLRALLPSQPDLCKPNRAELSEAVRRPIATVGDAHDGARVLLDLGARAVLCSLDKYGVLYVDREQAWHAWTPPVEVRSDVGAGDSALAAFLSAADEPARATRLAAAWGAAACRQPGSRLPRLEDIDLAATEVTGNPDRTLRLR